jgi:hypothetical protein
MKILPTALKHGYTPEELERVGNYLKLLRI